jgi:uracil-DNA glycosylase
MADPKELLSAYFKQQADLDMPPFIFSDSFHPPIYRNDEKKSPPENSRPLFAADNPPHGRQRNRPAALKPLSADKLMGQRKNAPPVSSSLPSVKRSGLASLFHDVKPCQNCGLGKSRKSFVFGSGNPDACFMVIGSAPEKEDDSSGMPFSGQAGDLLTKMLAAINIDRTKAFITTVVKCRPPNDRAPDAEEIRACGSLLTRQIEIIAPKVFLILGDLAAHALLGAPESVDELRLRNGALFYKTIPAFLTYHPAAILRDNAHRRPAWEDLQKLQTALKEAGIYDTPAQ